MRGTSVIDIDVATLTKTLFHGSPDDTQFAIEEVQDVTDIVNVNKELYNSVNERTPMKHMQRVASIPDVVWFAPQNRALREGTKAERQKALRRFLNDSDNAAWRTRPGTI